MLYLCLFALQFTFSQVPSQFDRSRLSVLIIILAILAILVLNILIISALQGLLASVTAQSLSYSLIRRW